MSNASNLAGFVTSISPINNLNDYEYYDITPDLDVPFIDYLYIDGEWVKKEL